MIKLRDSNESLFYYICMKSLYTYLLNEARGLLREEYDYEDIVDFVTDLIISDADNLSKLKPNKEYLYIGDETLKSVYPKWIGGVQIFIRNTNGNEVGSFTPSESIVEHDQLYFDIYVNVLGLAKHTNKNKNTSTIIIQKLCKNALQHEFKHAFDEWIRRVKNLTNPIAEQKYFRDMQQLDESKLGTQWKKYFKEIHYLHSKFEKTAHQQEYLYFYRKAAFGSLFINILKNKYQTPQKLIDYIINMPTARYSAFYFDICEEMSEVLKGGLTEEDIAPVIFNPYIDYLWLTQNYLNKINSMSEEECESIMSEIENIHFHGIKIPKIGLYKERLDKLLNNIKLQQSKYLKTIFNKSF